MHTAGRSLHTPDLIDTVSVGHSCDPHHIRGYLRSERYLRWVIKQRGMGPLPPRSIPTVSQTGGKFGSSGRKFCESRRPVDGSHDLQLLLPLNQPRSFLEKPPVAHLLKNSPAFYRTQRFITAFTRTRHLSLSRARQIQLTPQSYFSKINFSIILLFTSKSSQWFLSSRLSYEKSVRSPLLSHACYMSCQSHPSRFDHPSNF